MQPEIYSSIKFKQIESDNTNSLITKLCTNSKKISKKRTRYRRIDDDIRQKLIDAVLKDGQMLKTVKLFFLLFLIPFKAAKSFQVNYSSAKSIFHTFRKEGRVNKKMFRERHTKKPVGPKLSFDSTDSSSSESHLDSPLLEKSFKPFSPPSFKPSNLSQKGFSLHIPNNYQPQPTRVLPTFFPSEQQTYPQFPFAQCGGCRNICPSFGCREAPQIPTFAPLNIPHQAPQKVGPFAHPSSALLALQSQIEKSYFQLFNAQNHSRFAHFPARYQN